MRLNDFILKDTLTYSLNPPKLDMSSLMQLFDGDFIELQENEM